MTIYTDPVAQVIFTQKNGDKEWKWTAPDNPFVTGVTLNWEFGKVGTFTIAIDIPYEYGLPMLQEPSPFIQGTLVKARIGYASGEWTPWAGGFLAAGGAGLAVDSNSVAGVVSVQAVSEKSDFSVSREILQTAGWAADQILAGCCKAMSAKLTLSELAAIELNSYKLMGEGRGTAIRKIKVSFASGLLNLSYMEAIRQICGEHNLTFWIGPRKGDEEFSRNLFVVTSAEASRGEGADQDKDVNTYQLRGLIDEEARVYPCFTWEPEGAEFASWLANIPDSAGRGATEAYIDNASGELGGANAPATEQPVAISGSVTNTESDPLEDSDLERQIEEGGGTFSKRGLDKMPSTSAIPMDAGTAGLAVADEEAKKKAQHRQAQGSAAQRGVIRTIGIPDEQCGRQCVLKGVGKIYDDLYEIEKLSHIYAPGSWETTMTVHREGTVLKADGDQVETPEGQKTK